MEIQIKKRASARIVLKTARESFLELSTIRRAIEAIDERLTFVKCPIAITTPGRSKEFPIEEALDQKSEYIRIYREKYIELSKAIADAEELISRLQNAGARSALRLYYLAGLPTWEIVAEELRKDERTVRRWREMSFEILDKKYQKK